MKKKALLTIFSILLFSPYTYSQRGDHNIKHSCMIEPIYIDNNTNRITSNDFPSQNIGTLADNHVAITLIISVKECSITDGKIRLAIDKSSIDINNGYLKNTIDASLASKNVAFQLITGDDERAINLNDENDFFEEVIEGEAEFYFNINYVKKDSNPPQSGRIQSSIIFNLMIDDEIVEL
ncbi:fimbrial protein [Proteus cibi]|uniref:fimbrial protein n=1 Tax=Proteus cibi TaxID=2050966 RepID=UPI0032DA64BF